MRYATLKDAMYAIAFIALSTISGCDKSIRHTTTINDVSLVSTVEDLTDLPLKGQQVGRVYQVTGKRPIVIEDFFSESYYFRGIDGTVATPTEEVFQGLREVRRISEKYSKN